MSQNETQEPVASMDFDPTGSESSKFENLEKPSVPLSETAPHLSPESVNALRQSGTDVEQLIDSIQQDVDTSDCMIVNVVETSESEMDTSQSDISFKSPLSTSEQDGERCMPGRYSTALSKAGHLDGKQDSTKKNVKAQAEDISEKDKANYRKIANLLGSPKSSPVNPLSNKPAAGGDADNRGQGVQNKTGAQKKKKSKGNIKGHAHNIGANVKSQQPVKEENMRITVGGNQKKSSIAEKYEIIGDTVLSATENKEDQRETSTKAGTTNVGHVHNPANRELAPNRRGHLGRQRSHDSEELNLQPEYMRREAKSPRLSRSPGDADGNQSLFQYDRDPPVRHRGNLSSHYGRGRGGKQDGYQCEESFFDQRGRGHKPALQTRGHASDRPPRVPHQRGYNRHDPRHRRSYSPRSEWQQNNRAEMNDNWHLQPRDPSGPQSNQYSNWYANQQGGDWNQARMDTGRGTSVSQVVMQSRYVKSHRGGRNLTRGKYAGRGRDMSQVSPSSRDADSHGVGNQRSLAGKYSDGRPNTGPAAASPRGDIDSQGGGSMDQRSMRGTSRLNMSNIAAASARDIESHGYEDRYGDECNQAGMYGGTGPNMNHDLVLPPRVDSNLSEWNREEICGTTGVNATQVLVSPPGVKMPSMPYEYSTESEVLFVGRKYTATDSSEVSLSTSRVCPEMKEDTHLNQQALEVSIVDSQATSSAGRPILPSPSCVRTGGPPPFQWSLTGEHLPPGQPRDMVLVGTERQKKPHIRSMSEPFTAPISAPHVYAEPEIPRQNEQHTEQFMSSDCVTEAVQRNFISEQSEENRPISECIQTSHPLPEWPGPHYGPNRESVTAARNPHGRFCYPYSRPDPHEPLEHLLERDVLIDRPSHAEYRQERPSQRPSARHPLRSPTCIPAVRMPSASAVASRPPLRSTTCSPAGRMPSAPTVASRLPLRSPTCSPTVRPLMSLECPPLHFTHSSNPPLPTRFSSPPFHLMPECETSRNRVQSELSRVASPKDMDRFEVRSTDSGEYRDPHHATEPLYGHYPQTVGFTHNDGDDTRPTIRQERHPPLHPTPVRNPAPLPPYRYPHKPEHSVTSDLANQPRDLVRSPEYFKVMQSYFQTVPDYSGGYPSSSEAMIERPHDRGWHDVERADDRGWHSNAENFTDCGIDCSQFGHLSQEDEVATLPWGQDYQQMHYYNTGLAEHAQSPLPSRPHSDGTSDVFHGNQAIDKHSIRFPNQESYTQIPQKNIAARQSQRCSYSEIGHVDKKSTVSDRRKKCSPIPPRSANETIQEADYPKITILKRQEHFAYEKGQHAGLKEDGEAGNLQQAESDSCTVNQLQDAKINDGEDKREFGMVDPNNNASRINKSPGNTGQFHPGSPPDKPIPENNIRSTRKVDDEYAHMSGTSSTTCQQAPAAMSWSGMACDPRVSSSTAIRERSSGGEAAHFEERIYIESEVTRQPHTFKHGAGPELDIQARGNKGCEPKAIQQSTQQPPDPAIQALDDAVYQDGGIQTNTQRELELEIRENTNINQGIQDQRRSPVYARLRLPSQPKLADALREELLTKGASPQIRDKPVRTRYQAPSKIRFRIQPQASGVQLNKNALRIQSQASNVQLNKNAPRQCKRAPQHGSGNSPCFTVSSTTYPAPPHSQPGSSTVTSQPDLAMTPHVTSQDKTTSYAAIVGRKSPTDQVVSSTSDLRRCSTEDDWPLLSRHVPSDHQPFTKRFNDANGPQKSRSREGSPSRPKHRRSGSKSHDYFDGMPEEDSSHDNHTDDDTPTKATEIDKLSLNTQGTLEQQVAAELSHNDPMSRDFDMSRYVPVYVKTNAAEKTKEWRSDKRSDKRIERRAKRKSRWSLEPDIKPWPKTCHGWSSLSIDHCVIAGDSIMRPLKECAATKLVHIVAAPGARAFAPHIEKWQERFWTPLEEKLKSDPGVRLLLLHIGTNDVGSKTDSCPYSVLGMLMKLLRRVREVAPHLRIIMSSILPRMPNEFDADITANIPNINNIIYETNDLLEMRADKNQYAFLDNHEHFRDNPQAYYKDGLHLSDEGSRILAEQFRNRLEEELALIAEQEENIETKCKALKALSSKPPVSIQPLLATSLSDKATSAGNSLSNISSLPTSTVIKPMKKARKGGKVSSEGNAEDRERSGFTSEGSEQGSGRGRGTGEAGTTTSERENSDVSEQVKDRSLEDGELAD